MIIHETKVQRKTLEYVSSKGTGLACVYGSNGVLFFPRILISFSRGIGESGDLEHSKHLRAGFDPDFEIIGK